MTTLCFVGLTLCWLIDWLCAWAATSCISIDCPFFFERCRALRTTQHMFSVLRHTGMLHQEPWKDQAPAQGCQEVLVIDDDDDDDVIDLQDGGE